MNDIIQAIRKVLGNTTYLVVFFMLSALIFWLFLAIPVYTIPGNDFAFQVSILPSHELLLLIVLSSITALSIVFHLYALRHKHSLRTGVLLVGSGSTGFLTGAIATIFGTATCAACVASIFGFLGVGGVLFLIQYRLPITIGAIIMLLVSLYFTSKKVLGVCTICQDI